MFSGLHWNWFQLEQVSVSFFRIILDGCNLEMCDAHDAAVNNKEDMSVE